MFQLIVAVISIALVAALAIASIFYGGDAFNQGSLKANVTTLVNGGQQIAGAQALYKTEHAGVTAKSFEETGTAPNIVEGLVGEYLTAAPGVSGAAATDAAWEISADGELASVLVNASAINEVCEEANRQAGLDEDAVWTAAEPTAQFGCFTDGTDVNFGFKL